MIFVITPGMKRNAYDTQALHDRIYKDLNQEGKHQVVMIPEDCKYKVIDDYSGKDVKVIIKEVEKAAILK